MNVTNPTLPADTVREILRKTSTFPKRDDWISFITPEDALAILQLDGELSFVARGVFDALLTNHEDSLSEIFNYGTLHARTGLNTVCIPKRVGMQSPLYEKILATVCDIFDLCDSIRTLDLDFLALSDRTIEYAGSVCTSLRTLGVRHILHENELAVRQMVNFAGL